MPPFHASYSSMQTQKALQRPEVLEFANFYMERVGQLSESVGYIALKGGLYQANKNKLNSAVR